MSKFKKIRSAVLGYPRIGSKRELKKALESFWKGQISPEILLDAGRQIRKVHWSTQKEAGMDVIPSNDFSFYDHMLDMVCLVGAIPKRFGKPAGDIDLDTYFAMARGIQEKQGSARTAVPAMEMTKWFDTNYHYLVPEFFKGQVFGIASDKIFREFQEARDIGIMTRPVLVGPVSLLLLGKSKSENLLPLDLLPELLPVYGEVLRRLKSLGAESVQMDEPFLVMDLKPSMAQAFRDAYGFLARDARGMDLHLTTYFGGLRDNLELACSLPVAGLHVDLVREPSQLQRVVQWLPPEKTLSAGVVNGRNIWKSNLNKIVRELTEGLSQDGRAELLVASSCSLLHVPLDLDEEKQLDDEIKSWLSFAKQKLGEIALIRQALERGDRDFGDRFACNQKAMDSRAKSFRIQNPLVRERLERIHADDTERQNPFDVRRRSQRKKLRLPLFPTTTIGSFPQTADIREARSKFKKGEWRLNDYEDFLRKKIKDTIEWQADAGLDVLVHGEFERNDMVEYFGEQLQGFAFTQNGWVQSYGSRCVKPPIIFGDVWRPEPMTVKWSRYAQSLTSKPVKGMLTGPITILQWSFVRDDQPRRETARQIALAIRDEVSDLEREGIPIIQIDEPAIREGLPLRRSQWGEYLQWAVECFKLASSAVKDETQIHTHMCYSEFNDIIDSIAAMDADVISIETSRSQMDLLDAFAKFRYPNEIGPGVYDIHSPRVAQAEEMERLLKKAAAFLPAENLWVNPDCGLKTRNWAETELSLKAMIQAAKNLRQFFSVQSQKTHP